MFGEFYSKRYTLHCSLFWRVGPTFLFFTLVYIYIKKNTCIIINSVFFNILLIIMYLLPTINVRARKQIFFRNLNLNFKLYSSHKSHRSFTSQYHTMCLHIWWVLDPSGSSLKFATVRGYGMCDIIWNIYFIFLVCRDTAMLTSFLYNLSIKFVYLIHFILISEIYAWYIWLSAFLRTCPCQFGRFHRALLPILNNICFAITLYCTQLPVVLKINIIKIHVFF